MRIETIEDQLELGEPATAIRGFNPTRRAFLNGCTNFARGILSAAVTVLLTPFLVSHLGRVDFGFWSLLGLFITYVALVDFGISGATAKFIGELHPGSDVQRARQIFTAGLTLAGSIALGAILLGFVFRGELLTGLGVFGLAGMRARVFLAGAIALFSFGLVSNCLQYVLLGLHRLDIANYIAGAVLLIQALGTVVVLEAGLGLKGLIILTAGTSALSIIAFLIARKKVASGLDFHWRDLRITNVKAILTFGIFLQTYALMGVFYFYAGKAIVGLRFGLAAVASFEVALRLPILLRQASLTLVGPMMPAVSHLDARGQDEEVRALLTRTLRFVFLLGAPLFVALAVYAGPILRLWVGPDFTDAVVPLRLLSAGLGLSILPDVAWFFLVGSGRHRRATALSLGQAGVGVSLCYFLAAKWGLVGVALGVLLTSLLGVLLYAALLVRERILAFSDLPIALGCQAIAIASASYLAAFILVRRFDPTYWNLALALLLATGAYGLWFLKGGVLESREKLFLRRFVPAPLHFLC